MAISTPVALHHAATTSNSSSYSTATLDPSNGGILIVCGMVSDTVDPVNIDCATTFAGATVTELVSNLAHNEIAAPLRRLGLWLVEGHTGTGEVTISGWAGNANGAYLGVIDIASGFNLSDPVAQVVSLAGDDDASPTDTSTLTFAALDSADSLLISFLVKQGNIDPVSEGVEWVAATQSEVASPNIIGNWQYQETATDLTSTWTWSGGQDWAAAGVEIAVAASGDSLTAAVLTTVPSLPVATLRTDLTAAVLTLTPTLPAANVVSAVDITASALTVTPTLPAATLNSGVIAAVLTLSPTLPVASFTQDFTVTAAVLTLTPSLPAALLTIEGSQLLAAPLTATPSLPVAVLETDLLAATPLTLTVALPQSTIVPSDLIAGTVEGSAALTQLVVGVVTQTHVVTGTASRA